MLERRRRITGLAALSLTAVGAVAGMEGTAFPTIKEPRAAAVGGGWLDEAGQRTVHFALNARRGDAGDAGHLNIRLANSAGAFWADVTSVNIIAPDFAEIDGVVRKAAGVYAACEGQPFRANAQDGESSGEGDRLDGQCADGLHRFSGEVGQGNLQVEGGIISPEKPR